MDRSDGLFNQRLTSGTFLSGLLPDAEVEKVRRSLTLSESPPPQRVNTIGSFQEFKKIIDDSNSAILKVADSFEH
jgi:hypothetical protein